MRSRKIEIRYGIHISPFGLCVIGLDSGRVCALSFLKNKSKAKALAEIRKAWPEALPVRDDRGTKIHAKKIFSGAGGAIPFTFPTGTDFQMKVWKALTAITKGKTLSYSEVAKRIGSPLAVRAVGNACGKNPIGFVIPCHRVLTSLGRLGGYRWGTERKAAILAFESAKA